MAEITQEAQTKAIIKALDSKRAQDIQLIGIRDLTIVADYFVIANGTSNTHTKALADEVEFQLKNLGISPLREEGYAGGTWVVLDYGDIVVHIFNKETRNFYKLEKLWSDGDFKDISQYLVKEDIG